MSNQCELCSADIVSSPDRSKKYYAETHHKLCDRCASANYARFWLCVNCNKRMTSFQEKSGGKCPECATTGLAVNCYECNSKIQSPNARNRYNGYYLCDSCKNRYNCVPYDAPIYDTRFAKIGSRRFFGLELETSRSENYKTIMKDSDWGYQPDGSISGMEFVSPPMQGNNGYRSIQRFTRLAREHDFRVNRACGFHLHIDVSELSEELLNNMSLAYQLTYPAWKSLVSRNRHTNRYCYYRPMTKDNLKSYYFMDSGRDKFFWSSMSNIHHYGTVEIRLHQGTLNFSKIINWVRAHLRFVDWTISKSTSEISDLFINHWLTDNTDALFNTLCEIFNNDKIKDYFTERRAVLCQATANRQHQ